MSTYHLEQNNRFVIKDYQQQRSFSSILPGIAGPLGIPMWVFYVNRGQGITSFGVKNKDHPVMEFQPANKAYQLTPFLGFRTFIKVKSGGTQVVYEPFSPVSKNRSQHMLIDLNELGLQEEEPDLGLQVEVRYFVLPEEPVAGLVRQVTVTNQANQKMDLEILDGLPVIIPYGVSNRDLKDQNRTVEAWMDVYNQDHGVPFFRLRSNPKDTAEVSPVQAGNFALACLEQNGISRKLPAIVVQNTVFGDNTSLCFPTNFQQSPVAELLQERKVASGRTPCAFFGSPVMLSPSESINLWSVFGNARDLDVLHQVSEHIGEESYFDEKRRIANALIEQVTSPIKTSTSSPLFDAYCRQTFLDNILRGGWPVHLGRAGKPVTYHIFSRKHGDPERDYNDFFLADEFYSQGNGNYRDVNQNRRSEIFFDPGVEDANIRSFISLIQADGYNPLVVKGSRFWVPPDKREAILGLVSRSERLAPFLEKPFTPGGLLRFIDENRIALQQSKHEFLQQILQCSDQFFDAEFGEGYWIDHWTYNLDLIDNFLAIYPDKRNALLFGRNDISFFDSPIFVQPRSRKYILVGSQPRQYESLVINHTKAAMIASRREYPNLMRTKQGLGEVYRTNLFTKLTLLALVKFASMDPLGMGIEMEAGRPAWCDALNGLPGLFGSSLSETFELVRLLSFLIENLPEEEDGSLHLPVETVDLLEKVANFLQAYHLSNDAEKDFRYWDQVADARESYRESVQFGFTGETKAVSFQDLGSFFSRFLKKAQSGIEEAKSLNSGIPPTYFYYEVEEFEPLHSVDGKPLKDEKQRSYIRVLRFRQRVLPIFLEGVVRMFKMLPDTQAARRLYQQVKSSVLYDRPLKMYRTNAPLEHQPIEIGRLKAFTPGWLENESIFLHMEYKYLLELLRAGLYEEFFDDFSNALVAFQDPERYGRSPPENSSFIVSSAHPDTSLHGAGFVARLTGANAEFLSIWTHMMVGPKPFFFCQGELCLRLQPVLPGWLFDKHNSVQFNFLGHCQVSYFNDLRADTFSEQMKVDHYILSLDGDEIEIKGEVIGAPYAAMVRDGRVRQIKAYFTEKDSRNTV